MPAPLDEADEGIARKHRPHRARHGSESQADARARHRRAVGADQGFYRSDDAGASWTRMGQTELTASGWWRGCAANRRERQRRLRCGGGGAAPGGAVAVARRLVGGGGARPAAGAGGGAGRCVFGGAANPAGQDPHYY
jgi:hypothetical protein